MLKVNLSNRLEGLYGFLKESLFENTPFERRLVVVPNPLIKNWLQLELARDPDIGIAMGIDFVGEEQAIDQLGDMFLGRTEQHRPSRIELAFAIEMEIVALVNESLDRKIWEPLIRYLGFVAGKQLTRKTQRRIGALADKLAKLFDDYGKYGGALLKDWEGNDPQDWQVVLWARIFAKYPQWTYPYRRLAGAVTPPKGSGTLSVHVFAQSFLSTLHHSFLQKVSQFVPVHYYLLSPCQMYWSDIRSARESRRLQRFWQRKGASQAQREVLQEMLQDTNQLLASFGRLGRQTAAQLDTTEAETRESYSLPSSVENCAPIAQLVTDEIQITPTKQPFSLLNALQADLLLLRNPAGQIRTDLDSNDQSIQLHIAPSHMREVQILYNTLIGLLDQDPGLTLSDVVVMAPDMRLYEPYVKAVFGARASQLPYHLLDQSLLTHSRFVQSFLELLSLASGRWEGSGVLALLESPYFQKRHRWMEEDVRQVHRWIKDAGIVWGLDNAHRDEVLSRAHCQSAMEDRSGVGTWEYGFGRLLQGLIRGQNGDANLDESAEWPANIEFSQADLLGRLISLVRSLRQDLQPLVDGTQMTLSDWVDYFIALCDAYFEVDSIDSQAIEDRLALIAECDVLRRSGIWFGAASTSYDRVRSHLEGRLEKPKMSYREGQLQQIRFCSLTPLRTLPAQVVALIGMDESAFPRNGDSDSLNLLKDHPKADYAPTLSDFDRYLFLESLVSARRTLVMSYTGIDPVDGKEAHPALPVTELMTYLDAHYTMAQESIVNTLTHKHPFYPFDAAYFQGQKLCSFSKADFQAAKALYAPERLPMHRFVNGLKSVPEKVMQIIELKDLQLLARDPIQLYCNRTLGLYLRDGDKHQLPDEESFILNSLERYRLKNELLRLPVEAVLSKAQRQAQLPLGTFREIASESIRRDAKQVTDTYTAAGIGPESLLQVDLNALCETPRQLSEYRWQLPALVVQSGSGQEVKIVGHLPYISPAGLVVWGEKKAKTAIKTWPAWLVFQALRPSLEAALGKRFEPHLLLLGEGASVPSFGDAASHLSRYIDYYYSCLRQGIPLVDEWVEALVKGDTKNIVDAMRKDLGDNRALFRPYLRWAMGHGDICPEDDQLRYWIETSQMVYGALMEGWKR